MDLRLIRTASSVNGALPEGEALPHCLARSSPDYRQLGRLFEASAELRPDAPALRTSSSSWTYRELRAAAQFFASKLAAHDFVRGERVILLLPNSPEYVASLYGVLLAGGVIVPLPPTIEADMLRKLCASTASRFIATSAALLESRQAFDFLKTMPAEAIDLWETDNTDDRLPGWLPKTTPELAAIFFTAGSTGVPRGVMLSHQNLIANARAIQEYLAIHAEERALCVLPVHHAFGNSVLQSHVLSGSELVFDGHPAFPETIIESLRKHDCTSFSAVPDLFLTLLEYSSLGRTAFPRLRYMAVAGGALPHEKAVAVARRIAPAEFYVMYGQTEATARLAYLPPGRLEKLPGGCIGRGVPGVRLEVMDEQGRPAADNETGELCAQGPNVMLGYWRDPQATAERLRGGWLHTGDLAARDSAGWFYYKGRRNALVKIAGFRVHPADLEEFALRRLPVSQAVVVAFERQRLGTRLALFVRPRSIDETGTASMIARCRAELPRHLIPDVVKVVDQFPLNHALKIDRPLLSRLAAQEAEHCGSLVQKARSFSHPGRDNHE